MLLKRRQPDKPAAALNKFCSIRTSNGVYTEFGIDPGLLLESVHAGDIIICSELSRLGRNLFMIMEILNHCMEKDCRLWTIKGIVNHNLIYL
ncbi:MAG: recombinase family protein [Lachnospiraceae bacterium]